METMEGLERRRQPRPVQEAFVEEGALQCGDRTPGRSWRWKGSSPQPRPSREEIQRGVSGNLCRCGTYPHIFKAVRRAAELKRKGARDERQDRRQLLYRGPSGA